MRGVCFIGVWLNIIIPAKTSKSPAASLYSYRPEVCRFLYSEEEETVYAIHFYKGLALSISALKRQNFLSNTSTVYSVHCTLYSVYPKSTISPHPSIAPTYRASHKPKEKEGGKKKCTSPSPLSSRFWHLRSPPKSRPSTR